jgi:hypothetical protein
MVKNKLIQVHFFKKLKILSPFFKIIIIEILDFYTFFVIFFSFLLLSYLLNYYQS